jgi:hypothetical protein
MGNGVHVAYIILGKVAWNILGWVTHREMEEKSQGGKKHVYVYLAV